MTSHALTDTPRLVVERTEEPRVTEDDPAERHEAHEVDGGDVAERTTDLEDRLHGGVCRAANERYLQPVLESCKTIQSFWLQRMGCV